MDARRFGACLILASITLVRVSVLTAAGALPPSGAVPLEAFAAADGHDLERTATRLGMLRELEGFLAANLR
jgi:hypothetical protein